MARTIEYLDNQVKADRKKLLRLFRELKESAGILADNFDPQFSLDDQGDRITNAAADLGPLMLEILEVGARIVALEEVPRVG